MIYPSLAGIDSIAGLEALYFNCPLLIADHAGYNLQYRDCALYFNSLDESDIVEKIKILNNIIIKDELNAKSKIIIKENTCYNYINTCLNIIDNFYLTRQCWSLKENYKGAI